MTRPALSNEQLRAKRGSCVNAALALYRTDGYEAVTLRNVARDVGMSHVAVYRYFDSKEALIAAAQGHVFCEFGAYLKAADPISGDPMHRLRRIARASADYALNRPDDYRFIFNSYPDLSRAPPVMMEARQGVVDQVVAVFRQAVDQDCIEGEPLELAQMAWAGVHGLLNLHVNGQLNFGTPLHVLVENMLHHLLPSRANVGAQRLGAPKEPASVKITTSKTRNRTQNIQARASRKR